MADVFEKSRGYEKSFVFSHVQRLSGTFVNKTAGGGFGDHFKCEVQENLWEFSVKSLFIDLM